MNNNFFDVLEGANGDCALDKTIDPIRREPCAPASRAEVKHDTIRSGTVSWLVSSSSEQRKW